jgi:hypothetical protein
MRTILFALVLSIILGLSGSAAEPKKTDIEKPPLGINVHFAWCAKTKSTAAQIARYEGFWAQHHPEDENYDDGAQIRYVRLCAYRLAKLYADAGNAKKCSEMLKWLEKTDDGVKP